ncbi:MULTISPECIES: peptidoglycan DD-metalloendopeptidase family protein [unclassified Moraxella]|uniref:peptidoglycan DD-metalloendopeptidase family protein n=1 Tax=unclassified Moraxella TaxID=2685852 RepID=UPI003AF66EC8
MTTLTTLAKRSQYAETRLTNTPTLRLLASMALATVVLTACSTTPSNHRPVVVKGVPSYYVVQNGDTLSKIASRYSLDYRRIGAMNGLDSNYTIYKGQRLVLVSNANRPTQTPTPSPTINTFPINTQPVNHASTVNPSVPNIPLPTSQNWRVPVNGSVLSTFNQTTGIVGTWYTAPENSPVMASQAGSVLYAGSDLPEYGKMVMIQHTDGYVSAYTHLGNINVRESQVVQSGQQIGSIGIVPTLKQPAMQLQIRHQGVLVNPNLLIK